MISGPGSDFSSSDHVENNDTVGSLEWRPVNLNQEISHQGGFTDINSVNIHDISLNNPGPYSNQSRETVLGS